MESKAYVVFDFDGTIINGDISHSFAYYMASQMKFLLRPSELELCLLEMTAGDEQGISDFCQAYRLFYQSKTSVAKMRFLHAFEGFYANFFAKYGKDPIWFIVHSYREDEVKKLAEKAFAAKDIYADAQLQNLFATPSVLADVQKILENLQSRGFIIYICSASAKVLVEAINYSEKFKNVRADFILANNIAKNDKGEFLPCLARGEYLIHSEGKVKAILENCLPRHQGRSPYLLAGDSKGDLAMLRYFLPASRLLLIDRRRNDSFSDFILELKQQDLEAEKYQIIQP